MTFNSDVLNTLAAIGSAFGLYQVYVWIRAIHDRAIVLIGILPHGQLVDDAHPPIELKDLGVRKHAVEFTFQEKRYFALRGHMWHSFDRLAPYRDSERRYRRNEDNTYVMPILLANNGRVAFGGYRLTIVLTENLSADALKGSEIRITDIVTEDAEVGSIFANPQDFRGKKFRDRVTDERIYKVYEAMGLTGNLVVLTGELEAGVYELMHLSVKVPGTVDQFCAFFTFESPRDLFGAHKYCQLVTIEDPANGTVSAAKNPAIHCVSPGSSSQPRSS